MYVVHVNLRDYKLVSLVKSAAGEQFPIASRCTVHRWHCTQDRHRPIRGSTNYFSVVGFGSIK